MKNILFFILFFTPWISLNAQDLSPEQIQKLDDLVLSDVNEEVPGLAVGILQDGKIVYERYAGLANMEHSVAIDAETRFNIASNAKQFTALVVLTLVEKGLISLEEDIRSYLPELYKDYKGKITVAQLINHSSGIRDFYNLYGLQGKVWWAQEGFSNKDALSVLQNQVDLNFEPGTQHLYSNSNYVLLTEIVKKVTEKDFAKVAAALFQDLGMVNTAFNSNYMKIMPNKARPYANWGSWREYPFIVDVHGDGGLFTTLRDQLQWEQIVYQKETKSLKKSTIEASQNLLKGTSIKTYGYGVEIAKFRGIPLIYHDGNTGAYNASFFRFPEDGISVVAMSNNSQISPHYLASECSKIVLDPSRFVQKETAQRPKKLDKNIEIQEALGYYEHEDGAVVRFIEQEGNLYWKVGENRPFKMLHEKGNLYQIEESPEMKVSFHLKQDETQKMVVYYPGSEPREHIKYPELEKNTSFFEAANGRFANAETGTEVGIRYEKGKLFTLSVFGREVPAEMLQEDILSFGEYKVRLDRTPEGGVDGLKVDDSRLRNVRFERIK